MRVALLGAGLQAQAACLDLVRQPDLTEIVVADVDRSRADALARRVADPRVRPAALDAGDPAEAEALLRGARAALSTVPYRLNATLARAAVAARCSFCDLGGNNDVVAAELALDAEARAASVSVIPDCGLAPGLASILTAHAMAAFELVDSVAVRVGGIPARRGGLLDYSLVFSVEGLINEYVEDALVLEDGEPRRVPSLEGLEALEFPPPFGALEAFHTSGGASTLPHTYRGRIRRLDYKTIRYPGHAAVVRALKGLGLFSSEPVTIAGGQRVVPRALFAAVAGRALDRGEPDVTLLRLVAEGRRGGRPARRVYELVEHGDAAAGLTAMQRTTAFPATIVHLMQARGEVPPGAVPQERCVDPARFLVELERRGIRVAVRDEPSREKEPGNVGM